ncbi:hypothetical protein [Runella slithyformis]|uniref:Lipocalin-like domain-containing protein n=1 Tax=Runella slithyformis (strain ATCC 29530 / DSM 19594 / LMG 11500 / NCIMB 11436 / LSU 4) TaxID=761193 RepID=A0A7U3ZNV2_RUNSL|nr:hypothetical protein [Runella slithyformis]AEI50645.1 hypothetical protein Runsl_4307 [Runella slithyformis DSM 19594]
MKFTYVSSKLTTLFLTLAIVSCSKNKPEPSIGAQVSGSYTLIKILFGPLGVDYPFSEPGTGNKTAGKVEISKVTDDKVSTTLIFIETDKTGKVTEKKINLGEVGLQKATTGEIEAYNGMTKIGTYSNGTLILSVYDPTLGPLIITGKKN